MGIDARNIAAAPAAAAGAPTDGQRRRLLGGALGAAVLPAIDGCSLIGPGRPAAAYPAVVFVHGNGDSAAQWLTALWRFESNGWPRERLWAIDQPYPVARDEDDRAQPGRSSTAEHLAFLSAEIDRVRATTGVDRVALVGNSRGGLVIRNYVRNGGGPARVSHAVLGGVPNHGVWATDFRLGSEFNGRGPFLAALNAPQGPRQEEATPGVRWLTLRSDHNDKYAQPDGRWIGQPKMATGVDARGPELRGATNLVLPGLDHREVSYSAQAFARTFAFLLGAPPARTAVAASTTVVLDGKVTGLAGAVPTNLALRGARVTVYPVSSGTGERTGAALLDRQVGPDGWWGPLVTRPDQALEFVVAAPDFATVHTYRSPFPRSSSVVHLRAARATVNDRIAGAVVTFVRPRGYFDLARDRMSLDGQPLPGVAPGVAGSAAARLVLPAGPQRSVQAVFNDERIAVRTWPAGDGHLTVAELHG